MVINPAILAGAQIGGGLLNSALDRRTSVQNTKRTIQANKEMAAYAYSKDLEMWNNQNAYNTPENQMKRFKDAGLNPNLIYGQGNPGNATQLPKYNAPTMQYNYKPMQIPDVIGMYQDVAMKQAQINNVREQNKVIRNNAWISANKGQSAWSKAINDWQYTNWLTYDKNQPDHNKPKQNAMSLFNTQLEAQKEGLRLREKENLMKALEIEWRQAGMTSNDKLQWRMLKKLFDSLDFTW